MEPKHRITIVGIATAYIQNTLTGSKVDGWQEDSRAACLSGPLYHQLAVFIELLAIEMAVGIDIVHLTV